ncbi:hypothetical protein T265_05064 [Opisthorchis viverrini]|uniref:UAS domain-containing protein n=1 Tax=Opisthorchis viverrini TaxID=6198 RepID=A0A074ZKY9_OPIVI|nr:hypothetical protein T265_05064 [Opisthorchis viverrini]KER28018.1 hypothetical protein T265_05064 [Opisthorchis viverrini]
MSVLGCTRSADGPRHCGPYANQLMSEGEEAYGANGENTDSSLTTEQNESIQHLQEISGSLDRAAAHSLLEECSWDLERAVNKALGLPDPLEELPHVRRRGNVRTENPLPSCRLISVCCELPTANPVDGGGRCYYFSNRSVLHIISSSVLRGFSVWAPWQYPSPRTTMTYTTNNTLMPHQPSRGAISRVALLAAYSRAVSRFPSSALPRPNLNTLSAGVSSRTDRFARPASHSAAASTRPSSVTTLNTSKSVFKPRKPVYLATFNVRTLKQAGQQVALARTLDSPCIDVCCLSETRTQDASTVIELTAPSLSSRFRLRTSGDAEAAAAGYAGVGIVLSERAKASLLDWIPVDSRLCAVRLATSVRESRGSEVHRTLFIVSAYAPTDCSSESAKDSFYDALGALLQQAKSSDIVVVAGNMNAQLTDVKGVRVVSFYPDFRLNAGEVTDPVGDVQRFIAYFKSNYMNNGKFRSTEGASPSSSRPDFPPFYEGSYAQALQEAKRSLRFLVVYLHGDSHEDTRTFCEVSRTLREHTYPFIGVIGLTNLTVPEFGHFANSTIGMALLGRIEGAVQPIDLIQQLTSIFEEHQGATIAARLDRREREAAARIREEQDLAYKQSLERDRAKLAAREEEQRNAALEAAEQARLRRRQDALKRARANRRTRWRVCLPPEPEQNSPSTVQLSVKLPNGRRVHRTFRILYYFILSHDDAPENFEIQANFPKRLLPCQPEQESDLEDYIDGEDGSSPDASCHASTAQHSIPFDTKTGGSNIVSDWSPHSPTDPPTFLQLGLSKPEVLFVIDKDA